MKKALYFHWLGIAAFVELFGLLMLWQIVLAPSTTFPVALILLINITPLLFPLRGFLKGNKKSCSWMAYLSLFFLIHGIVECYANDAERGIAALEIIFSLQLFWGSVLYVRTLDRLSHV